MNLEDIPDPSDLPEGYYDGWGHLHFTLAWLAMIWLTLECAGFQSQASNKAVMWSPNKTMEPGWCHTWPNGSSGRQRYTDLINDGSTRPASNGVAKKLLTKLMINQTNM